MFKFTGGKQNTKESKLNATNPIINGRKSRRLDKDRVKKATLYLESEERKLFEEKEEKEILEFQNLEDEREPRFKLSAPLIELKHHPNWEKPPIV